MKKSIRIMALLCGLTLAACASDTPSQGEDAQASLADTDTSATGPLDVAEDAAEPSDLGPGEAASTDGGSEDVEVDPCTEMRSEWAVLFDEARACTTSEECSKPYLDSEPCSCAVYVAADADMNAIFTLDAELKAACVPDDIGCPAVECPQGVASCEEGLCVTAFD